MIEERTPDNTDHETAVFLQEFKHLGEFDILIDGILPSINDIRKEEILINKFTVIFGWYQEQPHLLDPFLGDMLRKCLAIVNQNSSKPHVQHFVFKVIYLMTKTRGYKNLIRLMPHAVDDLELVFDLLCSQDTDDHNNWQTRYILLLWLSIVVMVPFGLERLEKPGKSPLIERVMFVAKKHALLGEVTQDAASYLLARFVSRPDVYPSKLEDVISWAEGELKDGVYDSHEGQMRVAGCLRSLANICKIVPRSVLFPHANRLLNVILTHLPEEVKENILLARLRTKLLQRVGLLFCPRRAAAASWRYQRGFRSLADNLNSLIPQTTNSSSCGGDAATTVFPVTQPYLSSKLPVDTDVDAGDDDFDVPEEVAEVVDLLINALRSKFTYIRWSAAKGLGRICSRLTAPFVEDVLTAILSLCTRLETFTAWHGACFALAELGRRCLLLPEKLPEVIPVVLTALFYDEKSGDCNFGSNVRDAACYCCWAFARAYMASDFACHVQEVSQKLILAALFDRELNVRRAAAAAFQENVGRQGQFANGIEIITAVDYFAVGNLNNCYLNLSEFVASFREYTSTVVDHLAFTRLGHWDDNVRDLAARALHKLTSLATEHIQQSILPRLMENVTGADLYMRQGSVLGIAELVHALSLTDLLPDSVVEFVKEIHPQLESRKYFRGVTGELMRRACGRLIEKVSISKLPLHEQPICETWRCFLDDCLVHKEVTVRDSAIAAYSAYLATYLYAGDGSLRSDYRDTLLAHLLESLNCKTESGQVGYLGVLSRSPGSLFVDNVEETLQAIGSFCQPSRNTLLWGNARKAALTTLTQVVKHIGLQVDTISDTQLRSVYPILINALADYTVDSRGDIGSIVRESGMKAILDLSSSLVAEGRDDAIESHTMEQIFIQVAQQAVEKIDRTRAVAGQVFAGLLHHEPKIPHIPHAEELRQIFTKEICANISWLAAEMTFPLFVRLFDFLEFHYLLVHGFSVSVGGVTEKTVKGSSAALREYLIKHETDPDFILRLMKTVGRTFVALSELPRICLSLLRFLDFLLCEPIVAACMADHLSLVEQMVNCTWKHIRLSKEIPKLKASIDIYGAALQFEEPVRSLVAQFLTHSLRHRYPIIRKTAASKLFECHLLYDIVDPDVSEEFSNLLTDTVWENEIFELKPTRLRICDILGVASSTRCGSEASIPSESA